MPRLSRVKRGGRGGFRVPGVSAGPCHSTITSATASSAKAYDDVWHALSAPATGDEATTTRVSGSITLPSLAAVVCQPGGSSTVTPADPARGRGAAADAVQPASSTAAS